MITLFISSKCPDCPEAVAAFKNSSLNYEIIDITENMPNLKLFLKYRDFSPYFNKIKDLNRVGVPSILLDDEKTFVFYDSSVNLETLDKRI